MSSVATDPPGTPVAPCIKFNLELERERTKEEKEREEVLHLFRCYTHTHRKNTHTPSAHTHTHGETDLTKTAHTHTHTHTTSWKPTKTKTSNYKQDSVPQCLKRSCDYSLHRDRGQVLPQWHKTASKFQRIRCTICFTSPNNHQKKETPHLKDVCLPFHNVLTWFRVAAKIAAKSGGFWSSARLHS